MLKNYFYFTALLALFYTGCKQSSEIPRIQTSNDYQKGESLFYTDVDSAFYYYNKAANNSKDSLEIAMAYNRMAIIQSDAGDYFNSQESLLQSLKHLDENNPKDYYCLYSDYNELGITNMNLKNYDASIQYLDEALKYANDTVTRVITLSNKAVTYQKNGQYDKAISIYDTILSQSRNNKKRYARLLSNLAKVKWLQNPDYKAAPQMMEALNIRQQEKDNWGLNASYAHLSDYYANKHPDSALLYAKKMYAKARELNSPDDQVEALQKLLALAPDQQLKNYFERYQLLSDSIQTGRNNAKNQFALIRFDAEKTKSENLQLQKENAEKKTRIIQLIMTIALGMIGASFGFYNYRKRKQRLMREQKLRTSQKVHDVVANGLYQIMTKIEHNPVIDKEQLLDKMEVLYEQSRDISYEGTPNISRDYTRSISNLLSAFSTNDRLVSIAGNTNATWNDMSPKIKTELEQILQEWMVNMKKHSKAKNAFIKFERTTKELIINYSDDGVGLPVPFKPGNGWINTENRISKLNGTIKFGSFQNEKGLKIQINIPIT